MFTFTGVEKTVIDKQFPLVICRCFSALHVPRDGQRWWILWSAIRQFKWSKALLASKKKDCFHVFLLKRVATVCTAVSLSTTDLASTELYCSSYLLYISFCYSLDGFSNYSICHNADWANAWALVEGYQTSCH